MATVSGTATDWLDLYNELRDFLTTNATLVADGEEWTQIAGNMGALGNADEILLQGPGSAGTDEVLVAITPAFSVGADYFNLGFTGLTTYNAILGGASAQLNNSGARYIYLWEDPIDYWFVANGRRFIVVARVGTNWFTAYCGFILPFELPTMWPYPLFIGASDNDAVSRWATVTQGRKNFFDPSIDSARLMLPDVLWYSVANWDNNGSDGLEEDGICIEPWRFTDKNALRDNLDGSYALEPARLVSDTPYEAQLGNLHGVYRVSGFSNTPGAIITVGADDYLVVPNVYRNSVTSLCAIKLD